MKKTVELLHSMRAKLLSDIGDVKDKEAFEAS